MSRVKFLEHQKRHDAGWDGKEPEFKCTKCEEFVGQTKKELARHVTSVHNSNRLHVCHICGKDYTMFFYLKEHIRTAHEEARTEQCEICSKFFFRLKQHKRRMHIETEMLQCTICPMQCSKANMKVHMRRQHGPKEKLNCHLCGKEYKTKRSLKEHIDGHAGKRIPCDFCSLQSTSSGNWYNHMMQKHAVEYAALKAERKVQRYTQARVKNSKDQRLEGSLEVKE